MISMLTNRLKRLVDAVDNLLFPRCCPVCGRSLNDSEKCICEACFLEMPRPTVINGRMTHLDILFLGTKAVDAAISLFQYNRQSLYANIIKDIKYHNSPQIGMHLAERFAREHTDDNWFADIDMVIPVPLHASKLRRRGYNQSVWIARGISEATKIPVVEAIYAAKPHRTQTSKSVVERRQNVKDVFDCSTDLTDKTVLIVDDVITTGATISECADLAAAHGAKSVKVLSLAFAESV